MGKLFYCEIEYMASPHLMQLYSGFIKLQKEGVIDLKLIPKKYDGQTLPVVKAIINKKHEVYYDTQDGLMWVVDSRRKNLEYFQQHYKADFYFKRSYTPDLLNYSPQGCKVFPLGLNYNVHPDKNLLHLTDRVQDKFKYFIKTNKHLKKIFNKSFFYAKDFEYYPIKPINDRILFLTRVWNPDRGDVLSEEDKSLREAINDMRVRCIEACKKAYGDRFTGGLWMDEFSSKKYGSLAIPFSKTNKFVFLEAVKSHSICIATTGLYYSTGWKLAEYVAASRAIVTEPLHFEVPGDFQKNSNYLEFTNESELLESIDQLLTNKELMVQIMKNNYHYYNNYLKPDILVLNTLITVANNT